MSVKILGIDPGSRVLGYALIETKKITSSPRDVTLLDIGTLRLDPTKPLIWRLARLHDALHELLSEWLPHAAVVESAFFGINARSALALGQARGSIIAALSRRAVPVMELSPAKVKKTITGSGRATKEHVCQCVEGLLGFKKGRLSYDATDALAIALSFALVNPTLGLEALGDSRQNILSNQLR